MDNNVEKIIREYDKKLKSIKPVKVPEIKEKDEETRKKQEDEKLRNKSNLKFDIRHLENDINEYKQMLDNNEIDKAAFNELVASKQEKLDKSKKALEKLEKEETKQRKAEEKLKNERDNKLKKNNNIIKKINAEIVLPRGEVPFDEKYKVYINNLRDTTIRQLYSEKKNIEIEKQKTEIEIQKAKMLLEQNKLELLQFKIIYEEKDGIKTPINGEEHRKLLEESDKCNKFLKDLSKNLDDLHEMEEKCDEYIEKLKQPLKGMDKDIKLLKNQQNENSVPPPRRGDGNNTPPSRGGDENDPPPPPGGDENDAPQQEGDENDTPQQEGDENDPPPPPGGDENNPPPPGGDENDPPPPATHNFVQIEIGTFPLIKVGYQLFTVDSKELKKGFNLSTKDKGLLIEKYINNDNQKALVLELLRKKQFDLSILNIIDKADEMPSSAKQDIAQMYIDKCIDPRNDMNDISINYDLESLSKVSLLKRIFRSKKELNNKEKFEMLSTAKSAEKAGIATIEGEYKIGAKEKLISMFTRKQPLTLPSKTDMDFAYEYNENLYGKESNQKAFKESLKVSKDSFDSRKDRKEFTKFAKDQRKTAVSSENAKKMSERLLIDDDTER